MRVSVRPLLLVLLLAAAVPAQATDCTTAPAPQVDWQRCYLDERDLNGHDLTGSRLRETSFQRTLLKGANFTGVDAYRARFISADLTGARLDGGIFVEADFTRAKLDHASLRQTDLRRSRFFNASLRGADLTGAKILGAELLNADLSGARWIDGTRICAEGSIGQCN